MRRATGMAVMALALSAACGRRAEPPPAPAAVAPDNPAIKRFCVRNFERIRGCFDDEAYWDTFVTFYFAGRGGPIDPDAKRRMIGNLKDDVVKLMKDHAFAQNCDAMISNRRLPTPEQIARVRATDGKSCAEFGSQLGWVIFHEGVFHLAR